MRRRNTGRPRSARRYGGPPMGIVSSPHPNDDALHAYGLGKLDGEASRVVNDHLMECSACRNRVATVSSDSFLSRLRDAQGTPGTASFASSRPGEGVGGSPAKPETLPPGLANHPDYEDVR